MFHCMLIICLISWQKNLVLMMLYFAGRLSYRRPYTTCDTVFDNFISGDDNEYVTPIKEQIENVIELPQKKQKETPPILQKIQKVLLENRPKA